MWRIPCGINVVGLSFFFSFSLLLLLLLLLFYSPTLTFRFWQTNAACVLFCLFPSPAPNAEVQKLWRRSFSVAGAVTGAPMWMGGPLGPARRLLTKLHPRPLYQTACPAPASPSTNQVATSHLLWLNNQCKKKKNENEKKKQKKK